MDRPAQRERHEHVGNPAMQAKVEEGEKHRLLRRYVVPENRLAPLRALDALVEVVDGLGHAEVEECNGGPRRELPRQPGASDRKTA